MSARNAAGTRSKSGSRNRAKGSSSASLPFLESASPLASLPPSEDSVAERALAEEDNSELGDASVASSVGGAEDPVTPSQRNSKKRARLESSIDTTTTPVAVPASDERNSTGGDPSTKIRIPYSKLRGSGVLNSPLFQSTDATASADGKLKIVYSRPGQPERSGTMRLDFPELTDYPATTRALTAVAKGEQYGNVAKREVDSLRDEMERLRTELRHFDLEVRRELDVMAETRAAPGLPDPRSSPALQRRRVEDVKPLRQSATPTFVDPNKKRLKKKSGRIEEDEEESIDVLDIDAKAKQKRDQRKREKEALEAASVGESKKYNLKARGKDKKSKSKKGEDEEAEPESENDAESLDAANLPSTAGGPSNPFWAFVHQFIRDFVEEDLLLLLPRQLSAADPAFMIPPLGRHWTEFRKPKSEDADGPGDGESEQQPVHCGELTQRILASLIEDRLLPDELTRPPVAEVPAPVAGAAAAAAPTLTSAPAPLAAAAVAAPAPPSAVTVLPLLDSSAFEFPEAEAALPLSAPPTGDYSFTTMLSLEERIKLELKALGLFDPEENPVNHSQEKEEDNEIVQEIRTLQNQLREQVAKNNGTRERILELAASRLGEQKKDRDVRGAHAELEKAYIRVMQRRKPKRKKGPGRKGG